MISTDAFQAQKEGCMLKTAISVTCSACGSDVTVSLHEATKQELWALRKLIDEELKTRSSTSRPVAEKIEIDWDRTQEFLHWVFEWWTENESDLPEAMPAESFPPMFCKRFFKGKNPAAQFGLWLYHRSKDKAKQAGLYVRQAGWAGDKRTYRIVFELPQSNEETPQEQPAS